MAGLGITDLKKSVADSKVSAVSWPEFSFSTTTLGSILKISASCFFRCRFMSSDFFSTLCAKTCRQIRKLVESLN